MSKKKVLLRGVFINRDTNGEGVLKVGTTLIRVSTVMGILYNVHGVIIEIWYLSCYFYLRDKPAKFVEYHSCHSCIYG